MFRYLVAILFFSGFAAQTFNRVFIVLDYYANTASFIKDCENKTKPAMHCNGKCGMMKKLNAEEKKEQQAPERKGENKAEVLSSASYFTTLQTTDFKNKTSYAVRHISITLYPWAFAVFRPPLTV